MLPSDLYRAADVRELDRRAIEVAGIPGIELMERAGREAFGVLRERWPAARHVAIVAGPGNNGGDGYVVARLAAERGLDVSLVLTGDAGRIAGDALTAYRRMRDAAPSLTPAVGVPGSADVVVDALFGTGLRRDIEGPPAQVIRAMNASRSPVLAIDVPSGIHSDTGRVLGCAVHCDATVSFIGLKQGLFTREGRGFSGEVVYRDLGVPLEVFEEVRASARRIAFDDCSGLLGSRPHDSHKGRFGHVLVVGGDSGFAGAVRLAGEAAGRTGAGLVTIASRHEHVGALVSSRPELMAHGIESPDALDPLIRRASVIAVGPGLGQDAWGMALLAAATRSDRALVVDADALNLLARGAVAWPDASTRPVVYTPHPGEAGRVLGEPAGSVETDRFESVRALVSMHAGTWLLKGAGTIVAEPASVPRVCDGGNPGMAGGGMGDVLTGVIAALLAQGCGALDAASAGACLHAAAGDAAARDGERGMLAGDVIAALRPLANRL